MRSALALLGLVVAACAGLPPPRTPEAPRALAEAEAAFAARSVRVGMKAAFLHWLAPGSTLFRAGPVDGPAAIASRPDPPIVLDWRPAFVEVARSGEMGLSTGPWTITSRAEPSRPPRHGQFVSVWKRSEDERWRVWIDLGISNPGPALADAPLEAKWVPMPVSPASSGATIEQAEAGFARRASEGGDRAAYAAWGSGTLRLYREGEVPHLGLRDALESLGKGETASSPKAWSLDRHETAASGDLGFAIGRFGPPGGGTAGHFLRIWRREDAGWRIALDIVDLMPARAGG